MTIVEQNGGQYHVLLIIADGQVTQSFDTQNGGVSPQERKTIDDIVRASRYPLSVVLVGVGDGPWDRMRQFDDNIPACAFDNFQSLTYSFFFLLFFLFFMGKNLDDGKKEAEFAASALMEIPCQYKATLELGLLGRRTGNCPNKIARPPPVSGHNRSISNSSISSCRSSSVASAPAGSNENQVCPICLVNAKNMAFNCGHQTCDECGNNIQTCPICRVSIAVRFKLY
ncbi:unnamed protein product [Eruca vesicaria subsp. sativa]|uniref:RING-type domain-containing protein n=1 Tax=Eruca vesicaria subsp. sativa TaxID=29727 RepID=A0ABC8LRH1_ERUVS|nr:unnamed protein product [Eruca vesicaria subsp. sativa]